MVLYINRYRLGGAIRSSAALVGPSEVRSQGKIPDPFSSAVAVWQRAGSLARTQPAIHRLGNRYWPPFIV